MIELRVQEQALLGVNKATLDQAIPGYDLIRQIERYGILEFMKSNVHLFVGRVLDFGSGTQPYKHLISGKYTPHEKGDTIKGMYDTIICNQVFQYLRDPEQIIESFHTHLTFGGYLVMTYATNWDEVEDDDLTRITKSGMTKMLEAARFNIIRHERRSQVSFNNFKFPLGYGVVAQTN